MLPPSDFAVDVLQRLPLAEAGLHLWHWPCDAQTLNDLFAAYRGAGYTNELTFATVVALRGRAQGELTVTDQAAYQKLDRLPLAVEEVVRLVPGRAPDAQRRRRELLHPEREYKSADRLIQEYRLVRSQRVQT